FTVLTFLVGCLRSVFLFFFSSRRRHTRSLRDWSSDVCSSDLETPEWRGNFSSSISSTQSEVTTPLRGLSCAHNCQVGSCAAFKRSEERRVGKECRSRWWTVD